MAMKLYYGGFGDYMEFTVAENETDAIRNVGIKINAPFLPITVTEISVVEGFAIRPAPFFGATVKTIDEKPVESEIKAENSTTETVGRRCKKCDFTCDNQGELLAHYRAEHPKGD